AGKPLPGPDGADAALGGINKSVLVGVGLESNQIVVHEQAQKIVVWRQGSQNVERRKRSVQEEPDAAPEPPGPQFFSHGHEVVIVDPHDIIIAQQAFQMLRKPSVDAAVGFIISALVMQQTQAIMQQGPQYA